MCCQLWRGRPQISLQLRLGTSLWPVWPWTSARSGGFSSFCGSDPTTICRPRSHSYLSTWRCLWFFRLTTWYCLFEALSVAVRAAQPSFFCASVRSYQIFPRRPIILLPNISFRHCFSLQGEYLSCWRMLGRDSAQKSPMFLTVFGASSAISPRGATWSRLHPRRESSRNLLESRFQRHFLAWHLLSLTRSRRTG